MNNETADLAKRALKKVLLIYPGKSVTAYWLDGRFPLQYLEKQQELTFIEKTPRDRITKADLEQIDLVYSIRCLDSNTFQVRAVAKELNKPFVFFADDNFLISPENGTLRQKSYTELARRLVAQADAVVVVSAELLNTARQFNQNVAFIVPYQIFLENLPVKSPGGPVTIGHMSTLYREKHLEFVIPAIKRILDQFQDQVRLEFIGYRPEELMGYSQVAHFNFLVDYLEFRHFLAGRQWDIGIAPLKDDPFIRSKTDNKFREFSAHQICGVYSKVKCYTDWVRHGETGYLVENTAEEWYQALRELIVNEALRQKIVAASYQYVKEHYKIEDYCNRLLTVFKGLW